MNRYYIGHAIVEPHKIDATLSEGSPTRVDAMRGFAGKGSSTWLTS